MFNFLLRIALFFAGLIVAASLAVAALLLLGVWAVRLGWAKLTGKPVTPWSFMFGQRFDPRQGFDRFRAASSRSGAPTAADVAAARAHGASVRSPMASLRSTGRADVTDVSARPVDPANGGT